MLLPMKHLYTSLLGSLASQNQMLQEENKGTGCMQSHFVKLCMLIWWRNGRIDYIILYYAPSKKKSHTLNAFVLRAHKVMMHSQSHCLARPDKSLLFRKRLAGKPKPSDGGVHLANMRRSNHCSISVPSGHLALLKMVVVPTSSSRNRAPYSRSNLDSKLLPQEEPFASLCTPPKGQRPILPPREVHARAMDSSPAL